VLEVSRRLLVESQLAMAASPGGSRRGAGVHVMQFRGQTRARLGFMLLAACVFILTAGVARATARDAVGTAVAGPTPGIVHDPSPGAVFVPGSGAAEAYQDVTETPGAVAGESYLHVGAITFRTWTFKALDVPAGSRPFDHPTASPLGTDPYRVSMRYVDGVPYDFALRQAETGYTALNSYRLTGERYYLIKAQTQADHLISRHFSVGNGWFYPNGFYYYFGHTQPDVLVPPWYSGIAQGAAVGFFARLYEATGKQVYRDAAEHTLESFLVPQGAGHPWVSKVDSSGYLRIEEYPGSGWEFVFNGHMEAAMGLWDYYRVTHDARGLALYRGALTSVVRYGQAFRTKGWISAYSLGARVLLGHYHVAVMRQMRQLHTLSGDARFIHLVNDFDGDYPAPVVTGVVKVLPGNYTACRFSVTGTRLASCVIRPRIAKLYRVDWRKRIRGQRGIWLHLTSGSLQGYFIREAVGHVYVRGVVNALAYDPSVRVTLKAGHWSALQFDGVGAVTASQPTDLPSAETARVSQRAVVNGVPRVLLASDPFTDYWVSERAVVLP
jgi:hypothetical protein